MDFSEPFRILTRDELLKHDPCEEQLYLFSTQWPEQVKITVSLATDQAAEWDWTWASEKLLTPEGYKKWLGVEAQTMSMCRDALVPYRALHVQAYQSPDLDTSITYAALTAAQRVAWKQLQRIVAKTFAKLYIAEGD